LKKKGYEEVLGYTAQEGTLRKYYTDPGFTKGSDATCFWKGNASTAGFFLEHSN
jgi:hypothetical protein